MCRHLRLQGLRDERGGSLRREICVSLDLKQRFVLEVQIQELREV